MTEEIFYLTRDGLQRFKKEHANLRKVKVAKVKGEVPDILHSEEVNPEYLAFQEDLELLESRITEIENVLKNAEVIKLPHKSKRDQVHLGATVKVRVNGKVDEFTIVGSLEANPSVGQISDQSPVGAALMGAKVKEEVVVSSPIHVTYQIVSIRYE